MLNLVLACLGLTYILGHSQIFSPIRHFLIKNEHLKKLFSCFYCLGFNAGLFIALFSDHPDRLLLPFISCWVCGVCEEIMSKIEKL